MILTGEAMSSDEALSAGLVAKVFSPEELLDAAISAGKMDNDVYERWARRLFFWQLKKWLAIVLPSRLWPKRLHCKRINFRSLTVFDLKDTFITRRLPQVIFRRECKHSCKRGPLYGKTCRLIYKIIFCGACFQHVPINDARYYTASCVVCLCCQNGDKQCQAYMSGGGLN